MSDRSSRSDRPTLATIRKHCAREGHNWQRWDTWLNYCVYCGLRRNRPVDTPPDTLT